VSFLTRIIPVERDEWKPVLLATAYGFLILFSYYILRAVRDEISAEDRGNLQILWTAVFLVMLIAVPMYSSLVSRYSRAVFVPIANLFFASNLVLFWFALQALPVESRPWIDRVFYVWASVFALFVVTVFWGLVVDLFRNTQGKRVFGFIAIGSSVGGIVGSGFTAWMATLVPTFVLLLVASIPLVFSAWMARLLHHASEVPNTALRQEKGKIAGTAWSGIQVIRDSRYLQGIALFIALMTFASTILYFQQSELVYGAMTDRGVRTAFLAKIDLVVNILTIGGQGVLAAHLIRWLGVGVVLAIVPAAAFIGFIVLGLYPSLAVLVVVQVIYRAGRYALARPAREVLFTVVSREERYKSKAFIDAAVYRGGDLVSGWIYAGLAAAGLTVGSISLVAAPMMGIWVAVGLMLGRAQERMAAEGGDDGVPAGAEVPGEPTASTPPA
jgi:AAA family ATP:ADP antiporter